MRRLSSASSSSGVSTWKGRMSVPVWAVVLITTSMVGTCGSGWPPLCRGGEEVDKQLVDAFRLVVMHPVRRVGQALHAVGLGTSSPSRHDRDQVAVASIACSISFTKRAA